MIWLVVTVMLFTMLLTFPILLYVNVIAESGRVDITVKWMLFNVFHIVITFDSVGICINGTIDDVIPYNMLNDKGLNISKYVVVKQVDCVFVTDIADNYKMMFLNEIVSFVMSQIVSASSNVAFTSTTLISNKNLFSSFVRMTTNLFMLAVCVIGEISNGKRTN